MRKTILTEPFNDKELINSLESERKKYLKGHLLALWTFRIIAFAPTIIVLFLLDYHHSNLDDIAIPIISTIVLSVMGGAWIVDRFFNDEMYKFEASYRKKIILPYLNAKQNGRTHAVDYDTIRALYASSSFAPDDTKEMLFSLKNSWVFKHGDKELYYNEINVYRFAGRSEGKNDYDDYFQGIFISAQLDQHYDGLTLISNGNNLSHLKEMSFDNKEFMRKFDVQSSDKAQAHALLQPRTMQYLINLDLSIYESVNVEISENRIFIFLETDKNLLDPLNVTQPVNIYTIQGTLEALDSAINPFISLIEILNHETKQVQKPLKHQPESSPKTVSQKVTNKTQKHQKATPKPKRKSKQMQKIIQEDAQPFLIALFRRAGFQAQLYLFILFSMILFFMYEDDPRSLKQIFHDNYTDLTTVSKTVDSIDDLKKLKSGDTVKFQLNAICVGHRTNYQPGCDAIAFFDKKLNNMEEFSVITEKQKMFETQLYHLKELIQSGWKNKRSYALQAESDDRFDWYNAKKAFDATVQIARQHNLDLTDTIRPFADLIYKGDIDESVHRYDVRGIAKFYNQLSSYETLSQKVPEVLKDRYYWAKQEFISDMLYKLDNLRRKFETEIQSDCSYVAVSYNENGFPNHTYTLLKPTNRVFMIYYAHTQNNRVALELAQDRHHSIVKTLFSLLFFGLLLLQIYFLFERLYRKIKRE